MKQIQEWLGHSDFSTTANIYSHLDYSSKVSSAEAMLNGLGMGSNPQNGAWMSMTSLLKFRFSLLFSRCQISRFHFLHKKTAQNAKNSTLYRWLAEHQRFELWRRYKRPIAFRVLSPTPPLTEFASKKRKLSEDDSAAKRRKRSKKKSFLTSKRRNLNPFQKADFPGKMREK